MLVRLLVLVLVAFPAPGIVLRAALVSSGSVHGVALEVAPLSVPVAAALSASESAPVSSSGSLSRPASASTTG